MNEKRLTILQHIATAALTLVFAVLAVQAFNSKETSDIIMAIVTLIFAVIDAVIYVVVHVKKRKAFLDEIKKIKEECENFDDWDEKLAFNINEVKNIIESIIENKKSVAGAGNIVHVIGDKDCKDLGGIGKTYTLKYIRREISLRIDLTKRTFQLPIFISLKYAVNNPEAPFSIDGYLTNKKTPRDDKKISYVFLLDGYNEINSVKRSELCREITNWKKACPKDSFIISGRRKLEEYDADILTDKLPEASIVYEIGFLSEEKIGSYLSSSYKKHDLLNTPFYLRIQKQTGKYDFNNTIAERWHVKKEENINKKSDLLWNYLIYLINHNLEISSKEREKRAFILTKLIPLFAYQTYRNEVLKKNENPSANCFIDFIPIIKPRLDYFGEFQNAKPNLVEELKISLSSERTLLDILEYLENGCGVLRLADKRSFDFIHDNYRDFFAALHIANIVDLIKKGFKANKIFLEQFFVDIENWPKEQLQQIDDILRLSYFSCYFEEKIIFLFSPKKDAELGCDYISHDGIEDSFSLENVHAKLVYAHIMTNLLTLKESWRRLMHEYCMYFVQYFDFLAQKDELYEEYRISICANLCACARNFRDEKVFRDIAPSTYLLECKKYSLKAISYFGGAGEKFADGYNHLGKCLNKVFENCLNKVEDFKIEAFDLTDDEQKIIIEAEENVEKKLVLAAVDPLTRIFRTIFEKSKKKYERACGIADKIIWKYGYYSKVLLIFAAMHKSIESLNTLACMLESNYDFQEENIKQLNYEGKVEEDVPKPSDNDLMDAFRLYYEAAKPGQNHQTQAYSKMKVAEFVLQKKVRLKYITDQGFEFSDNKNENSIDDQIWKHLEKVLKDAIADNVDMARRLMGIIKKEQNELVKAADYFVQEIYYFIQKIYSGKIQEMTDRIWSDDEHAPIEAPVILSLIELVELILLKEISEEFLPEMIINGELINKLSKGEFPILFERFIAKQKKDVQTSRSKIKNGSTLLREDIRKENEDRIYELVKTKSFVM